MQGYGSPWHTADCLLSLHLADLVNRITTLPDQIFVQLSKALSILDLQPPPVWGLISSELRSIQNMGLGCALA